MDIVTSVGSKLVELVVDPIMRQARYVILYKCNFIKLSKDLKDLEAARERVSIPLKKQSQMAKKLKMTSKLAGRSE